MVCIIQHFIISNLKFIMKQTKFNPAGKNESQFKSWIAEDEVSIFYFKCRKFHATLDLGNMGKGPLTKHMKSLKHIGVNEIRKSQSAGLLKSWAKSTVPTASSSSSLVQYVVSGNLVNNTNNKASNSINGIRMQEDSLPSINVDPEPTLNQWVTIESNLKAETMWALNCAANHFSHTSNHHTSATFASMFPDSSIAKLLACGEDKTSYSISFGLAPYFYDQLTKTISESSSTA